MQLDTESNNVCAFSSTPLICPVIKLVDRDLVDFVNLDVGKREPLIQLGLAGFVPRLACPWPY